MEQEEQHPSTEESSSSSRNNGRRKRSWSRAVFSNLQRKGLEKRFQLQKYITKPDRRQLAATLGLTDAQVTKTLQSKIGFDLTKSLWKTYPISRWKCGSRTGGWNGDIPKIALGFPVVTTTASWWHRMKSTSKTTICPLNLTETRDFCVCACLCVRVSYELLIKTIHFRSPLPWAIWALAIVISLRETRARTLHCIQRALECRWRWW